MNNNIQVAGQVLHLLLGEINKLIKPGITGNDINLFAEDCINNYGNGCRLACKGYNNFPASLCISINETIIHGIPNDRKFVGGDIVKVDIVLEYQGWFADSARTVICGKGSYADRRLVKITEESLYKGISVARKGWTIGDIGHSIQSHAESNGYNVMKEFSGHFIGKSIHLNPLIPCFGKQRKGEKLKIGDLLCIEPMLFVGCSEIIRDKNGWNIKSKDGLNTAHYEHTILITKNKPIIIT